MISDKKRLTDIIRKEIEIEDDMLELYAKTVKNDFIDSMSEADKNLAQGIIDGLLRDTSRHKKTMEEIINNLPND